MEYSSSLLSILIVEDQEEARENMMEILALKYPDISFLEASDGRSAMECFISHHPKIVVADVNLPDTNSIELCSDIRSIDANIKFLVISAHDTDAIRNEFVESGADICGYIPKPIVYPKLFAAIDLCVSKVLSL
jgi:DNA-binding NarL/FixJ family response regulator